MKKILLLLIFSQIIAQEALNETIVFESRNPFSFEEVITDLDNQETQIVTGTLGFPAGNPRVPVTICVSWLSRSVITSSKENGFLLSKTMVSFNAS